MKDLISSVESWINVQLDAFEFEYVVLSQHIFFSVRALLPAQLGRTGPAASFGLGHKFEMSRLQAGSQLLFKCVAADPGIAMQASSKDQNAGFSGARSWTISHSAFSWLARTLTVRYSLACGDMPESEWSSRFFHEVFVDFEGRSRYFVAHGE